jgi:hypothetical protein
LSSEITFVDQLLGVILTKKTIQSAATDGNSALFSIAICKENTEILAEALARVQGNAHADILCVDDLLHFAGAAERKLENAGIAASYRAGAILHVTPSGPSCTAYKYARLGTAVQLDRKASAWTLVRAYRTNAWPRQVGRQQLTLTPRQKLHVLKNTMKAHGITVAEAHVAVEMLAKAG